MNPYTVIYVETWFAKDGERNRTAKMQHVEAANPDEAIKPFNGASVFCFDGHLDSH